jgi:RNA-directed DNA polymerase
VRGNRSPLGTSHSNRSNIRAKMIMSSGIAETSEVTIAKVAAWDNLLCAWGQAARGKRGKPCVAAFEHQLADRLLALQSALLAGTWRPGGYVHFTLRTPKLRRISAAPFADRIVHHALVNLIEPVFERRFIADSYANRVGKGTHRAVDRAQALARRHRYVLRLDIVKHFPSIDHAILMHILGKYLPDWGVLALASDIIASGDGVDVQTLAPARFEGDDLLAACRPRGLPIGNLTSQFWSNCYLHLLDLFIKRALGCRAYIRYVDDMALFADSKAELWRWKRSIVDFLAGLRLILHEHQAQAMPVRAGFPWLGFVIYPTHRRVKGRKVVQATRRLADRFEAWRTGRISFGEFDASVQGWVNHVRYADTWGLREHVIGRFVWSSSTPAAFPYR